MVSSKSKSKMADRKMEKWKRFYPKVQEDKIQVRLLRQSQVTFRQMKSDVEFTFLCIIAFFLPRRYDLNLSNFCK